jgi:hypothetical protein
MAYTVTSVLERPNTGVSWFDLASKTDVRNEMKSFIDNNKKSAQEITESGDGLTLTTVTEFVNEAAYREFHNNSTIQQYFADRRTYYIDNSVSIDITKTES